jgi:uncharacterized protein YdhG (YjbR/CyaY superfamily)
MAARTSSSRGTRSGTRPDATTATAAGVKAVDAKLAKVTEPHRTTLLALRATLRDLLPHAEECLKYGMAAFTVQGKGVAAYEAFKGHCSYFPMSGGVLERITGLPAGTSASKGTLQFPVDRPLSKAVVRRLVRARLDEISDVTNGKRFDFFDDGSVKAEGSMKDGQLHGAWTWYRQDGTRMRTGKFAAGEQVGTWQTWDRDGRLVTSTTY